MRRLQTMLLTLLLTVVMVDVTHARALPEKEQRATLISILGGHHFRVDRKVFQRIGPAREVNKILVHIADDARIRPTVRGRAVSALRLFASQRTQRFLEGLMYDRTHDGPTGLMLRREAMLSLAHAFGEGAVVALSNHRDDSDPQMREGCARALGITKSARALAILEAWLPNEPELFVRLAVDRAIESLRSHPTTE